MKDEELLSECERKFNLRITWKCIKICYWELKADSSGCWANRKVIEFDIKQLIECIKKYQEYGGKNDVRKYYAYIEEVRHEYNI